jgi:hypothetical protein
MLAEVTHSGDGLLAGRISADRDNQIRNASGSDPDLARPETRIGSKLIVQARERCLDRT